MNNATNTTDSFELSAGRATMYLRSEFLGNIVRVEVSSLEVTRGAYAQYDNAIKATFVKKGCRNRSGLTQTSFPSLVILEGWNHPEPPKAFGAARDAGNGTQVSRSTYSSCDPRWQSDFDALLADHVAKTGAKILGDYRKNNPHNRFAGR